MADLASAVLRSAASVQRASAISYLATGNDRGPNVTSAYADYVEVVKAYKELEPDGYTDGFIYGSLDALLEGNLESELNDKEYRVIHYCYKLAKDLLRDYINRGGLLTGKDGKYLPANKLARWGEFLAGEFSLSLPVIRDILLEVIKERNLEIL